MGRLCEHCNQEACQAALKAPTDKSCSDIVVPFFTTCFVSLKQFSKAPMDHAFGPFPCLPLLPPEIQHQIFENLPYPDLLSLKLTNSYFYNTVETTVHDRADWLLDRAQRNLMIPRQSNCLLRSDAEFCSHPEVLQILRWRRKHLDCREPGGWCREVCGVQCKNRWVTFTHPYRRSMLYGISRGFCRRISALCAYLFNNVPSSTNIWFVVLGALIAIMVSRLEIAPMPIY